MSNPRKKLEKEILEKEKYSLHIIACLTVFMCAFCHTHIENLLKGPADHLLKQWLTGEKRGEDRNTKI